MLQCLMYVLSVVSETKSSLKPFEFPFDRGVKAQSSALLKKQTKSSHTYQLHFLRRKLPVNKQSLFLIFSKKNQFFRTQYVIQVFLVVFLLVCEPRGRSSKSILVKIVNIYAFFEGIEISSVDENRNLQSMDVFLEAIDTNQPWEPHFGYFLVVSCQIRHTNDSNVLSIAT